MKAVAFIGVFRVLNYVFLLLYGYVIKRQHIRRAEIFFNKRGKGIFVAVIRGADLQHSFVEAGGIIVGFCKGKAVFDRVKRAVQNGVIFMPAEFVKAEIIDHNSVYLSGVKRGKSLVGRCVLRSGCKRVVNSGIFIQRSGCGV